MDLSAQKSMKDAAKCDRRCEWQNSANQENAERILRLKVTPWGMSCSGRLYYNATRNAYVRKVVLSVTRSCALATCNPLTHQI